ncbi:DUF6090 family protein [Bizionia arctica]|uniref:Uncharacterized protein n=1 Tax=Bizionia arctica TaxID=1495645 RepID=A0A917LJL0_9FLAO|nr:DUF6090 family protein [Bizionia arctica]GGG32207.1 hypothetical protein GCM10010976_00010 [Bizionia arctica]
MIKFFRKIRQNMIRDNKVGKYLFYAIGEIVLVVIGILIALAINNNNEKQKTRAKELNYLSGIKSDINLNLIELKTYITTRETSVSSAENMLEFFNNKKEVTPDKFNFNSLNVQIWYPFKKNDNTYQELINSGNLAIISNDSIKDILINSQLGYKQITFLETHMQYDFENYIYPIYFSTTDLESDISNYTFQVSNGTDGVRTELSKEKIELLLKNQTFKNGFVLSIFNNEKLITEYKNMIFMTEKLIKLIDSELIKNK